MKQQHYRLFLAVSVAVILMSGCVSASGSKSRVDSEPLTVCSEPRPQMCTMDYRPVCGELQDGSFKTFSNGCMACADLDVVGYRDGECPKGK